MLIEIKHIIQSTLSTKKQTDSINVRKRWCTSLAVKVTDIGHWIIWNLSVKLHLVLGSCPSMLAERIGGILHYKTECHQCLKETTLKTLPQLDKKSWWFINNNQKYYCICKKDGPEFSNLKLVRRGLILLLTRSLNPTLYFY